MSIDGRLCVLRSLKCVQFGVPESFVLICRCRVQKARGTKTNTSLRHCDTVDHARSLHKAKYLVHSMDTSNILINNGSSPVWRSM